MGQGSLFETDDGPQPTRYGAYGTRSASTAVGAPFSRPGTSKQAAERIAPRVNEGQSIALEFIRSRGEFGATDDEILCGTDLNQNAVRARRGELISKGLVVDSGRKRKTTAGQPAMVWVAVEFARQ